MIYREDENDREIDPNNSTDILVLLIPIAVAIFSFIIICM